MCQGLWLRPNCGVARTGSIRGDLRSSGSTRRGAHCSRTIRRSSTAHGSHVYGSVCALLRRKLTCPLSPPVAWSDAENRATTHTDQQPWRPAQPLPASQPCPNRLSSDFHTVRHSSGLQCDEPLEADRATPPVGDHLTRLCRLRTARPHIARGGQRRLPRSRVPPIRRRRRLRLAGCIL